MALAKDGRDAGGYREARATCLRASRAEGIDRVLARDRLDAIVAPTGGAAWLTDPVHGDPMSGVSSSRPSAVAGYPVLTVPAAFVDGLPLGISFIGGAWSEAALLRLGYAFEQLTRARRAPTPPR